MPQRPNERSRTKTDASHIDEKSTTPTRAACSRPRMKCFLQKPPALADQDEAQILSPNWDSSAKTVRPQISTSYSESSAPLLRDASDTISGDKTRWPHLGRFRSEGSENSQSRGVSGSFPLPPEISSPVAPRERFGLFILKDQDPDDSKLVDIIAIHGLAGDAHETWTSSNNELWLRDFLPEQILNARIMTFGYDSSWLFSKNVMSITDFANDLLCRLKNDRQTPAMRVRPMIFVCHSLGGIVAKRAVTLAYENQELFGELLCAMMGIVFMGTPHRGSNVATLSKVATNVVNSLLSGKTIRKPLLKALCTDSRELEEISRSFLSRSGSLKIASFYEADAFPGLNVPIVPKESAVLLLLGEETNCIQDTLLFGSFFKPGLGLPLSRHSNPLFQRRYIADIAEIFMTARALRNLRRGDVEDISGCVDATMKRSSVLIQILAGSQLDINRGLGWKILQSQHS